MKVNQRGFSLIEGLLILLTVSLIGLGGWHVYHTKGNNKAQQNPKASNLDASKVEGEGTITGDPEFPSSGIPQDQKVCAENVIDSSKIFCDNVGEKQPTPTCSPFADDNCKVAPLVKFVIKVPVGEYYVYATAESRFPGVKVYNHNTSVCIHPHCEDANQKIVTVTAGAIIDNLPSDGWWGWGD